MNTYPILFEVPEGVEHGGGLRHVGILSQCGKLHLFFCHSRLVDGSAELAVLVSR